MRPSAVVAFAVASLICLTAEPTFSAIIDSVTATQFVTDIRAAMTALDAGDTQVAYSKINSNMNDVPADLASALLGTNVFATLSTTTRCAFAKDATYQVVVREAIVESLTAACTQREWAATRILFEVYNEFASSRCGEYDVCLIAATTARAVSGDEILALFAAGDYAIQASTGDQNLQACRSKVVNNIAESIAVKMLIPVAQSALRYAFRADTVNGFNADGQKRDAARANVALNVLASAVLSTTVYCVKALEIASKLRSDADLANPIRRGYASTIQTIQDSLPCLPISCKDIGNSAVYALQSCAKTEARNVATAANVYNAASPSAITGECLAYKNATIALGVILAFILSCLLIIPVAQICKRRAVSGGDDKRGSTAEGMSVNGSVNGDGGMNMHHKNNSIAYI